MGDLLTNLQPRLLPAVTPETGQWNVNWYGWLKRTIATLNGVFAGSIGTTAAPIVVPLAKLTGGGADGSVTFINGIATAYTAPT